MIRGIEPKIVFCARPDRKSDGKSEFLKPRIDVNSKEFYKEHPDLAPRDIYLREKRTVNMEDVRKTISDFLEEPWYKRFYHSIMGKMKK